MKRRQSPVLAGRVVDVRRCADLGRPIPPQRHLPRSRRRRGRRRLRDRDTVRQPCRGPLLCSPQPPAARLPPTAARRRSRPDAGFRPRSARPRLMLDRGILPARRASRRGTAACLAKCSRKARNRQFRSSISPCSRRNASKARQRAGTTSPRQVSNSFSSTESLIAVTWA